MWDSGNGTTTGLWIGPNTRFFEENPRVTHTRGGKKDVLQSQISAAERFCYVASLCVCALELQDDTSAKAAYVYIYALD